MVHVHRMSRRAALQAVAWATGSAALGAVASCGRQRTGPTGAVPDVTTSATVRPGDLPDDSDVAVLTGAVGAEAALLALCSGIRRRHPDLAPVVAPLIRTQRAHVRRLSQSLAEAPTSPAPPQATVPRSSSGALRALTAAFSAAEQDRFSECLRVSSGLLARILASASASHAVSVEAVRAAR